MAWLSTSKEESHHKRQGIDQGKIRKDSMVQEWYIFDLNEKF